MSQEKVDRYKQEKANRKQNMKKEKAKQAIRRCVVGVLGLALIGWLGYSAYNVYDSSRPKQTAQVDYTAITEYQSSLAEPVED
ncbi:MAG: hypothetical protein HFH13_12090 [Dorea sp.]|nr:hypothetical protein [Dorea sp.]